MRLFPLLVLGFFLSFAPVALAAPAADVVQSPSCRYCGMDREKFSHSRMFITYEDGSTAATCSLHCAAVELANTIDKIPAMVSVADYDSKELDRRRKGRLGAGGEQERGNDRQGKVGLCLQRVGRAVHQGEWRRHCHL